MSIVQQAGLVNSQNSHFSNPGFSSNVGAVSGCGGSVTSADALNNTGMYSMVKTGGTQHYLICPPHKHHLICPPPDYLKDIVIFKKHIMI